MYAAEQFTNVPGTNVPVDEAVEAFGNLLDGEYDDYPEQAFLNVGGIEDLQKKADDLRRTGGEG
jgi:F-type H+-transporting ATPase subunit beta